MAQHRAFVFLIVFVGGGIGSMLRHGVNQASASIFGLHFPHGTLIVNLLGSFLMGLIAGWFAFRGVGTQQLKLFLTTGVIGGFTTFSAFSLDASLMLERGKTGVAMLYIAGNVIGGIGGVFVGLAILRPPQA
jgi:CrcB protein